MKKFIGLLALFLMSAQVHAADWKFFDDDEYDDYKFYVDKDSIKKEGDSVDVQVLYDFYLPSKPYPDEPSYISMITSMRFNCAKETVHPQSVTFYTEHMGRGVVVHSSKETITPEGKFRSGSIVEKVYKYVCTKYAL